MNTLARITHALAMISALALASCASNTADSSGNDGAVRDAAWTSDLPAQGFWLSLTSHVEAGDAGQLRTSTRFVIEADGQLRAAQGALANEDTFPPPIRRLTREQLAQIWSQLIALDVVSPRSRSDAQDFDAAMRQRVSFTHLVASAHARQRSGIVRDSDAKAADVAKLVTQLSRWAWVGQSTPPPAAKAEPAPVMAK